VIPQSCILGTEDEDLYMSLHETNIEDTTDLGRVGLLSLVENKIYCVYYKIIVRLFS